ncbi:hypothetical protein ABS71_08200 [bacterium SCN 62-11]|nr:MAG: hypothetical protein ABS71_08200 [bacterium SCN 62-11]
MFKTAIISVALILPAAAIPVVNGGFESGDFTGWTRDGDPYFTYVDTDANFGTTLAHSGTYGAYLGPIQFQGSISQDLATVPGATYEISYWLANLGNGDNYFSVDFGGTVGKLFVNSTPFGYTRFSFFAVASAAVTPLTFTFKNVPETWTLDDIAVDGPDPAPELNTAGALPVVMFASLMLGLLTSRRQTQGSMAVSTRPGRPG